MLLTGLLSGLTYGLCSIFGKLLSRHLSPVTILSYALGIGAALLLVAALPTLRALAGLSFGSYALLFIHAVVHTALAFGLYTAGLKRLDAGQAAIVATVEPVAAGAIGVALFGEDLRAKASRGRSWCSQARRWPRCDARKGVPKSRGLRDTLLAALGQGTARLGLAARSRNGYYTGASRRRKG